MKSERLRTISVAVSFDIFNIFYVQRTRKYVNLIHRSSNDLFLRIRDVSHVSKLEVTWPIGGQQGRVGFHMRIIDILIVTNWMSVEVNYTLWRIKKRKCQKDWYSSIYLRLFGMTGEEIEPATSCTEVRWLYHCATPHDAHTLFFLKS